MRWKKTICAWGMLFLGLMVSTGYGAEPPLLFGTLPVIQALPIFVAQQEGYFESAGVRVEVVPFKAALEKDVALTAGRIDGYFGDLFTPIVLKANGVDIRIVARNFLTGGGNRMFAILAGPREELTGAGDLAGIPVAVSSNTIIDYVTRFLLRDAGVPEDKIQVMETKNIPIRYQMLVSGQVKAATLPEPLVTLAETQGCRVLADDSRSQLSSTVLVFSNRSIQKRGGRDSALSRGAHAGRGADQQRSPGGQADHDSALSCSQTPSGNLSRARFPAAVPGRSEPGPGGAGLVGKSGGNQDRTHLFPSRG